jgi:hypothetical protein
MINPRHNIQGEFVGIYIGFKIVMSISLVSEREGSRFRDPDIQSRSRVIPFQNNSNHHQTGSIVCLQRAQLCQGAKRFIYVSRGVKRNFPNTKGKMGLHTVKGK